MERIANTKGYAIGEMSRRTGVNIETIRYYERIGVLPRPDRTRGGNRQYNHDQLKRLFFVKRGGWASVLMKSARCWKWWIAGTLPAAMFTQ